MIDGAMVSIDEIFENHDDTKEALKYMAALFHDKGDIAFETEDINGVKEVYGCHRSNETVFLKEDSKKGRQFNPQRDGLDKIQGFEENLKRILPDYKGGR